MKRFLVPLMLATLVFPISADAQKASTKAVCFQRCSKSSAPPLVKERNEAKLKAIREKKQAETDPAKIKELEEAEADEIEKQTDAQEKMCKFICRGNPES